MHSHVSIQLITAYVFILCVNYALTDNFDDDGNEITMKHFLPHFQPIGSSEERNMTKKLDEHIQTGNLSLLLKLLKWSSGLQEELMELKTNVTQRGVRNFHGIPLSGPVKEIESFVNETMDFLKVYERKVEEELRKPSKEWNYPAQNP